MRVLSLLFEKPLSQVSLELSIMVNEHHGYFGQSEKSSYGIRIRIGTISLSRLRNLNTQELAITYELEGSFHALHIA